jgi:hypothetical protein
MILTQAREAAQRRADLERIDMTIWKRVDDYPPEDDRAQYRIQPNAFPDQPTTWAKFETIHPAPKIEQE